VRGVHSRSSEHVPGSRRIQHQIGVKISTMVCGRTTPEGANRPVTDFCQLPSDSTLQGENPTSATLTVKLPTTHTVVPR